MSKRWRGPADGSRSEPDRRHGIYSRDGYDARPTSDRWNASMASAFVPSHSPPFRKKGVPPMLYALIGYLKPGAAPVPQSVQVLGSDFLGQPFTKIHSAGPLRDAAGNRAGMLMLFESESRAAAEAFVQGSPYIEAGVVEDHRLYEYANEVG